MTSLQSIPNLRFLTLLMSWLFAGISLLALGYAVLYFTCYRYPNSNEVAEHLELRESILDTKQADVGLFAVQEGDETIIYEFTPNWVKPWSSYFTDNP